jgi:uncharacterized membrane protein YebE (DUF533 family)
MRTLKTLLLGVAVTLSCASAMAYPGEIRDRAEHQEERIQRGVARGQLTREEAYRLERQQEHIRHEARRARADGWIDPYERARIERMQDRANRNISREKHDGDRCYRCSR